MSKAALFVGINNFKNYAGYRLRGCINDTVLMRNLYIDVFKFDPNQCGVLTDSQATKLAIMSELQMLIDRGNSGELSHIVFAMSSHGTQVRDRSGDEFDGRDEAFVCHDLKMGSTTWVPETIILDDEFNALFNKLDPAVLLEVFLDTCHSGSGLRGAEFGIHRAMPRYISLPDDSMDDARLVMPRRRRSVRSIEGGQDNRIMWAGCKDNQTSADAYFYPTGYNGAFTYHYCAAVRSMAATAPSRNDILLRVRSQMATKFAQTPQLETNALNRASVVVVP
jgi:hypothetical protein